MRQSRQRMTRPTDLFRRRCHRIFIDIWKLRVRKCFFESRGHNIRVQALTNSAKGFSFAVRGHPGSTRTNVFKISFRLGLAEAKTIRLLLESFVKAGVLRACGRTCWLVGGGAMKGLVTNLIVGSRKQMLIWLRLPTSNETQSHNRKCYHLSTQVAFILNSVTILTLAPN